LKRSKLIFIICLFVVAFIIWRGCVYKPKADLSADAQSESVESAQADQTPADTDTPAEAREARDGRGARGREGKSRRPRGFAGRPDFGPRHDDWDDPNQPAEGDNNLEAVNLNNVEMKNVIQTLGDWTGKPIIPTSDEVMQQKITIYSSEKIPRSKALSLIYAALHARGVIAERSDDRIFLKPVAQAKLGSVPTLGVDDPLARIEDKSQVVEKFFKLRNYSPTRLAEIITPLTAEYGHVTAIENTGNITVIDTVESLMRIEQIISQLDVPESEQTVEEIFKLKNADPGEIVQVLQLILTGGKSSSQRGRSSRTRRPSTPQQSGEAKPATSVVIETEQISATLIPMPKQGWIIARASAEDMKAIAQWIKKLDIEEAVRPEQTVVSVTYVNASEVARAVNRTIGEMPGTDLKANVVVEALPQSKQIVIFGSEENRKMVEKLIAEIDLPTLDIFMEKTFKLKYADPDQIKQNIEGLYETSAGSFSSYRYGRSSRMSRYSTVKPEDAVKVISYPTLKQVTVIASEANLIKIENQIKEWDIPIDIEKDQYRIIALKNSDPVQMVNLLSKLFTEEGTDSSRSFMRLLFGGYGDEDEKKKIVGTLYGTLTFEAVPDTKKLIVISKIPEAYDVIEKLIKQLDSQEMAEVPRVITLKYADAEDLCDQLNAILNEPGTTATIRRSQRGLSVDTMSASTSSDSGTTQTSSDSGSTDIITPWWDRQRSTDTEMPTSNLIGKIRFIPVHRSKAVLVLAPPEYLEAITAMIEQLDQPGKQVMIKAVILQVDHTSMTSLGVQLATNAGAFGALEENALNIITQLEYLETFGSLALTLPTYGIEGWNTINTLVDLLVKNANAKILNQPTLWTKDNEEAVFIKAQNIAFLSSDQADSTGQSVTSTYDYRDIGVTLRVRPNITPEKAVDVTINMEISELGTERFNNQPAVSKLNTTTNLIVNDGDTILLGGILFQKDSTVERKIPLLGDIPVAGGLFRHEETLQTNSELLAFITPYVIDDQTSAEATRQIEEPINKMETIMAQLKEIFDPNTPQ
jgi:general secretion pathway protein D